MAERRFTVQEVAEQVGRNPWNIRKLETRGVLPRAERDLNGWRTYTEADVERILDILYPERSGRAS